MQLQKGVSWPVTMEVGKRKRSHVPWTTQGFSLISSVPNSEEGVSSKHGLLTGWWCRQKFGGSRKSGF